MEWWDGRVMDGGGGRVESKFQTIWRKFDVSSYIWPCMLLCLTYSRITYSWRCKPLPPPPKDIFNDQSEYIFTTITHFIRISEFVRDDLFYSPIISGSDKTITASQFIRTSVNFARSSAFCFCATCFDSKDGSGASPTNPLDIYWQKLKHLRALR